MNKRLKLIFLLVFWIAVLICIIKVPAVGVITAIVAVIFGGYKKVRNIPIARIKRR